ncbi:MAG: hypothetical protein GTO03_14365, partial [Planctomycetales bacterium]|nr:hypothetical protein [Planctomycetales bacterium]
MAYTLGGTAIAGVDYEGEPGLSGTMTIPAGQSAATITITPVDDEEVEVAETVELTLQSSSQYTLGSPATATV